MKPQNFSRLLGHASLLWVIALAIPACQTTPPDEIVFAPVVEFQPVNYTSGIYQGEGRYPNLFSTASGAVWVGEQVSDIKLNAEIEAGQDVDDVLIATAKQLQTRFYIFELHIESMMSDTSVAYDAVGLRNMEIYLRTPGGNKIPPIQTIIGSTAQEEQVGALKKFNRSNIVIFPKYDSFDNEFNITADDGTVRLNIEAFNSLFYFEWESYPPPPPAVDEADSEPSAWVQMLPDWHPSQTETYQVLKMRFTELFNKLRPLTTIRS